MKIGVKERTRQMFMKLSDALKRSKSTGIVIIKRPGDTSTALCIMGSLPDNVAMIRDAFNKSQEVRQIILEAFNKAEDSIKEEQTPKL